ncbi:MAG: GC-type dockerin domain-anchored protein [Phycisphaerales bacterium]
MPVKQIVRWTIILCALVLCCAPASAQGQPHLDLISAWGGPVLDFQRIGNIGYAAVGQKLVILDMTDEANVQELSFVMMTGKAESVAVRGDYAYVGGLFDRGRLVAVNVANPLLPTVAWREFVASGQPPSYSSVQHMCFYGNLLFVHNRANGDDPVAYDVTNPAAPMAMLSGPNTYTVSFFDSITSTNYPARDFQIVGDLAYIATRRTSTTIAIFNMQPDPLHPTYVGRLTNTESATGHRIAVDGTKAAIQVQKSTGFVVRFVDVTNPASPVLRSANDDFGFARDVAVQGNLAFVADFAGGINVLPSTSNWTRLKGLAIFDITNLASPVLLGTYNTAHSSIREVVVSGNRAYAMCDGQGLVVLDVSNPANPTRIGGYYSPTQLRYMTKAGNLLYVADAWNGFQILDVSNPNATPTLVGVYRGPGPITKQQHWHMAVRDNLVYLAAGNGGIQIVDVTNPTTPTLVFQYQGTNAVNGRVHAIELAGNVLHAGQGDNFESGCTPARGFYNYDISNPLMIVPIPGSLACTPSLPQRLITKDGVTIGGGGGSGGNSTIFLDTSNPAGPTTFTTQPWGGDDLEVHGNYLYIADSLAAVPGLSIADMTNPLQPTRIGFWTQTDGGIARAVGVSDNRAFVGTMFWIDVLDISNPASPTAVARSVVGGASDVLAEGNICYSTFVGTAPQNPSAGLLIHRLVEPSVCGPADIASLGGVLEADHQITVDDLVAYLSQFFGNNLAVADLVGLGGDPSPDGQITVDDLVYFLSQFFSGCP